MQRNEGHGDCVLIIDDHGAVARRLSHGFDELGYRSVWVPDFEQAERECSSRRTFLLVTELRVKGRWAFDFVSKVRSKNGCKAVIVTTYPSVATAVHAVQQGFEAYLPKPASAIAVLNALQGGSEGEALGARSHEQWPSLHRTTWEYINQIFVSAGTISEAARRLGVDRRSLRRMLAKYPPAE
jgi:two-component system response regulator RegA